MAPNRHRRASQLWSAYAGKSEVPLAHPLRLTLTQSGQYYDYEISGG
jgi:hypothetical protein